MKTTTNPAAARLAAAIAAVPERLAEWQAARTLEESKRQSYRAAPIELSHATFTAERAHKIAEREVEDAQRAALAAGLGDPAEQAHPGRFGVTELAEALTPLALRRLELEEQIATVEAEAKAAVLRVQAARDAAAAAPRHEGLPPPGKVPQHMFAVLVAVERQNRSGRFDEKAIAAAVRWSSGMGPPEVPEKLRGRRDELIRAAIVDERPRTELRNDGRIVAIERELGRLEDLAADIAERNAQEEKEREARVRACEAEKERERERQARAIAERRAEQEKIQRENDARREAGRRAIAAGNTTAESSGVIARVVDGVRELIG